jgi:hypothetical protein
MDAEPSSEHFEEFQRQTAAEGDNRGAAILLATNVENCLETAIVRSMMINPERRRRIFGGDAPLGFSAKIRLADAVRIIGNETKEILETVRIIRNTFAHAKIPINFTTAAIADACDSLNIPVLLPPRDRDEISRDNPALIGKPRYQRVCNNLAHNLVMYSLSATMEIELAAIRVPLNGNYEVWARRKPLP